MIGIDILKPNTVVVKSILLTSLRIRGLNLFSQNTDIEKRVSTEQTNQNDIKQVCRLQNPGERISVLLQSPLIFCPWCKVVVNHLRQFLLGNCLILIHISYQIHLPEASKIQWLNNMISFISLPSKTKDTHTMQHL